MFLTKMQELGAVLGAEETIVLLICVMPLFGPNKPRVPE